MAQGLEQAVAAPRLSLRLRGPALVLLALLLACAGLALGGGADVLAWALAGLGRALPVGAVLAALYLAPGLALLRLLPLRRALHPAAALGFAVCLSTLVPPVLLLLARLLGLPWGPGRTWAYLLLSVLVALWPRGLRAAPGAPLRARWQALRWPWRGARVDAPAAALLAVTLAGLALRLYVVRDLPTGLLGDSYHHTLITQLLLDQRGLFRSWQPYAPLATLTYHFGFHANAAFVSWLTGLPSTQSVLLVGQLFTALAAPAVFALTVGLTGSAWAGVWAALVVGFASPHPGFYVNWGRYTQLAGHQVLVATVLAWVDLAEGGPAANDERRTTNDQRPTTDDEGRRTKDEASVGGAERSSVGSWLSVLKFSILNSQFSILLAALATAGMLLTHYLVTVFAAAFVGSYLVALVLARRDGRFGLALALRAAPAALLALLLAAPWLLELRSGHLVGNAGAFVSGAVQTSRVVQYSTLPGIREYVDLPVLALALLALLLAAWRRDWRTALFGLWALLLIVCVVPQVLALPGTGAIDSLTAFIALYLVAAPLAGSALAALQSWLAGLLARRGRAAQAGGAMLALALTAAVALGAPRQRGIVVGTTQMVTWADMVAIGWVRDNTPPDARFLVNSFPAYGGSLIAGTDAGWWLPLLAGRQVTVPPITYGSEQGQAPAYRSQVNQLAAKLRGRPLADTRPVRVDLASDAALELLRQQRIRYIYIGAHSYPAAGEADSINVEALRASPAFRRVYARNGVEIYQFVEGL